MPAGEGRMITYRTLQLPRQIDTAISVQLGLSALIFKSVNIDSLVGQATFVRFKISLLRSNGVGQYLKKSGSFVNIHTNLKIIYELANYHSQFATLVVTHGNTDVHTHV